MKPCDHCPAITWAAMTNPDNAEAERAIRADEARAWRNTLERAAQRVERLGQQIARLEDDKQRLRAENEQLKQRRSA